MMWPTDDESRRKLKKAIGDSIRCESVELVEGDIVEVRHRVFVRAAWKKFAGDGECPPRGVEMIHAWIASVGIGHFATGYLPPKDILRHQKLIRMVFDGPTADNPSRG